MIGRKTSSLRHPEECQTGLRRLPQDLIWHPSAKRSRIRLILLHSPEGCQLLPSGTLRGCGWHSSASSTLPRENRPMGGMTIERV